MAGAFWLWAAGYLSVLSDVYHKVFGLYGTDQLGQGFIDAALALDYLTLHARSRYNL